MNDISIFYSSEFVFTFASTFSTTVQTDKGTTLHIQSTCGPLCTKAIPAPNLNTTAYKSNSCRSWKALS